MSSAFPPQDLECPDPESCTVAVEKLVALAGAGSLRLAPFPAQRHWFRVYDSQGGYIQPNPGFGDTRFAPFDAIDSQERVPTLYIAETLESALLETSLHNVSEQQPRVIDETVLLGKLHARVVPPHDLLLADLRDEQLDALDLTRENVSSSSPEHDPCTRRVAAAIHAGSHGPTNREPQLAQGIVWHSRQAELTGRPAREVAVVFADRVSTSRGSWQLAIRRSASGSLLEGVGRLLLDEIADELGVNIETSSELDE